MKNFISLLVCILFTYLVQAQNEFDDQGRRHGKWEKYYENGSIRYRGNFEHGKEKGVFEFFESSNSKNPVIIKEFNEDGSASCLFFDGGRLTGKGNMIAKAKVGLWTYFRSDGSIQSQENYVDDKLEGEHIIYHPNGEIMERSFYSDDLLDGPFSRFKKDGTKLLELNYSKNELDGVAVFYTEEGQVSAQGSYVKGKKSDGWVYFIDGKQVSEKTYSTKKN